MQNMGLTPAGPEDLCPSSHPPTTLCSRTSTGASLTPEEGVVLWVTSRELVKNAWHEDIIHLHPDAREIKSRYDDNESKVWKRITFDMDMGAHGLNPRSTGEHAV